jgi:hypothetical protein
LRGICFLKASAQTHEQHVGLECQVSYATLLTPSALHRAQACLATATLSFHP